MHHSVLANAKVIYFLRSDDNLRSRELLEACNLSLSPVPSSSYCTCRPDSSRRSNYDNLNGKSCRLRLRQAECPMPSCVAYFMLLVDSINLVASLVTKIDSRSYSSRIGTSLASTGKSQHIQFASCTCAESITATTEDRLALSALGSRLIL